MRLDGNRILLREYRKEDLTYIRSWVGDPDVINHLSDIFLQPHTQNNTERFLNHVLELESTNEFHFVIEEKSTKEYIGQIDIVKVDWKNRVAEFGVVIGIKAKREHGYGYEAIKLLQNFVFNRLNLNRLELRVHDYNERAYKCYLKCGFKEEGRLRSNFYIDGKYTDTILMGILKSEFKA